MSRPDLNDILSLPVKEQSGDSLQVLSEEEFKRMLTLERKRSERSLKPLLLLLVDLSLLSEERDGHVDKNSLLHRISGLIREIDCCGWYQEGSLVGVLFAEIPIDSVPAAIDIISTKVRESLLQVLVPDVCSMITFTFHLFPEKYDSETAKDSLTLPFYPELASSATSGGWPQKVKRGIDLIGSLAAMVLFFPLFLIIPALIKLTSPGPVFFRQVRLGQFGRPFTFLKFRSMHINNDDVIHRDFIKKFIADKIAANDSGDEPVIYKIKTDPRLTPIGNFLRKSSLDELPQFLNVLKNDMSLVGPRPPIPYEVVDYKLWHRRRILAQKPGITGLWQVTGRSLTTFDGMVRLDLRYGSKRSLWLDLKLLLATPIAMIRGKGAY